MNIFLKPGDICDIRDPLQIVSNMGTVVHLEW